MSQIPPIAPPSLERCHDPLFIDARGHVVTDPFVQLGLDPAQGRDEETVRAAWAEQIKAHPPEQDPEGARRVRDARERLTNPASVFERTLGILHVPASRAWSLPDAAAVDADLAASPLTEAWLDAKTRLMGQAVLYALVEDLLGQGGE
jgi:hypothetical protein